MITAPTPARIPSAMKSASRPAGRVERTASTDQPTPASMASMAGCAHAKISWKKVTITRANSSEPPRGWSTTRSRASVMRLAAGGRRTTLDRIESAQPARSAADSGGSRWGRLQSSGCRSRLRRCPTPSPRWPTTPQTGMPSARSRCARSMAPPRARSSSIMVTTRQVGTPRRRTWASTSSERSSVQASATTTSASGAGARSPSRTRPTTSSSGLSASRLYVPGRSITTTLRPSRRSSPSRRSTVTPG
jgi:hypothetical protein